MKNTDLSTVQKCFKATGRSIKNLPIVTNLPSKDRKHAVDSYKMNIVIAAINKCIGADWNNSDEYKYRLWVYVVPDKKKPSGFRLSFDDVLYTRTSAVVPSCLTFRSETGAKYFIKHYLPLMESVYLYQPAFISK